MGCKIRIINVVMVNNFDWNFKIISVYSYCFIGWLLNLRYRILFFVLILKIKINIWIKSMIMKFVNMYKKLIKISLLLYEEEYKNNICMLWFENIFYKLV